MKKKYSAINKQLIELKDIFGLSDWEHSLHLHEVDVLKEEVDVFGCVEVTGWVNSDPVLRRFEIHIAVEREAEDIYETLVHELLHVAVTNHLRPVFEKAVSFLGMDGAKILNTAWMEEEEKCVDRICNALKALNAEEE